MVGSAVKVGSYYYHSQNVIQSTQDKKTFIVKICHWLNEKLIIELNCDLGVM